MLKGNQRYNGMITPSVYSNRDDQSNSTDGLKFLYTQNHDTGEREKVISHPKLIPNKDALFAANFPLQSSPTSSQLIKQESDQDFEQKIATHSIIGLSQDSEYKINKLQPPPSKLRLKRNSSRSTYHESLQRIGGGDSCYNHYQQHWFSGSLERLKLEDKSREERLEITRYELRRHLKQIMRSNLGKPDQYIENTSVKIKFSSSVPQRYSLNSGYDRLVSPRFCDVEKCKRRALPCTRYCTLHIMNNADQVLFDYCTAKFADNTQCSVPVFDITHELPLCPEHARKRDNYRMYQETKPKKLRKKVKPSAMIRPQKRNKKKKRPNKPPEVVPSKPVDNVVAEEICAETPELAGDMVEQVLALQEPDGLELVSVEQALVTQATNLLEESEINNVLSTIQADEFNDFFTDRNGEYEPTREETEELERALAAVDNDVKSLEKLSQSQGLLDSFLDEHTLVESLVQIPDVFHNGYTPCGDNIITQTSRLLSVEPHSQS